MWKLSWPPFALCPLLIDWGVSGTPALAFNISTSSRLLASRSLNRRTQVSRAACNGIESHYGDGTMNYLRGASIWSFNAMRVLRPLRPNRDHKFDEDFMRIFGRQPASNWNRWRVRRVFEALHKETTRRWGDHEWQGRSRGRITITCEIRNVYADMSDCQQYEDAPRE